MGALGSSAGKGEVFPGPRSKLAISGGVSRNELKLSQATARVSFWSVRDSKYIGRNLIIWRLLLPHDSSKSELELYALDANPRKSVYRSERSSQLHSRWSEIPRITLLKQPPT